MLSAASPRTPGAGWQPGAGGRTNGQRVGRWGPLFFLVLLSDISLPELRLRRKREGGRQAGRKERTHVRSFVRSLARRAWLASPRVATVCSRRQRRKTTRKWLTGKMNPSVAAAGGRMNGRTDGRTKPTDGRRSSVGGGSWFLLN